MITDVSNAHLPQRLPYFLKYKKYYQATAAVLLALACAFIMYNVAGGAGDVNDFLHQTIRKIEGLGVYGYFYFSMVYVLVLICCLPAIPLTASSGYLFGAVPGLGIVLFSAFTAASVSFIIGRTLLRDWAKNIIDGNPRWCAVDTLIGKEGLKVVFLLRLTPHPFGLSNYILGATAINFWSFFVATIVGFIPGAIGVVYAGSAGKSFLSDDSGHATGYYYATIGVIVAIAGHLIAKKAIRAMEEADKGPVQLVPTSEVIFEKPN